jgi:nondiscriminating aspartyl-tRNA synthetase
VTLKLWSSQWLGRLSPDKLRGVERALISEAIKKPGETSTLEGWVQTRRDHGKLIFLDLWDRSGVIQIVIKSGAPEDLKPQAAVQVTGKIQERSPETINPNLTTGKFEVVADEVKVLAKSEPLPFDIDTDLQIETFLDNAPLTLRSKKAKAIFKIQSEIARAFKDFLTDEGFTEIHTPKIVATATEGGANLFEIKYFDQTAFLAQSPQFYKQIMTGVFERVFEIGPVFRAEPHSTTRHVNEYVSLDIEMAFINDERDIIETGHNFMRYLVGKLGPLSYEFSLFNATLPQVSDEPMVITFKEAQEILLKNFDRDIRSEPDFEPGDEKMLGEYFAKEKGTDFIWVTGYPTKKRPFYTKPREDDKDVSRGFDLIFRGMEIITGGQRINSYDELVTSLKGRGLKPEDFDYYLQSFQYGMPPEGGFALGLERITSRLLGIENVRLATLFPRDINRLTP